MISVSNQIHQELSGIHATDSGCANSFWQPAGRISTKFNDSRANLKSSSFVLLAKSLQADLLHEAVENRHRKPRLVLCP